MSEMQAIAQDRFGLGARPDQAIAGDPRDWLLAQPALYAAAPDMIASEPSSADMLLRLIDYRRGQAELRRQTRARQQMGDDAPMMEAGTSQQQSRRRLRSAYTSGANVRVESALTTDTPFVERLVHFWANHFAISADKGTVTPLAASYEFEAIRPHVLGNFRQLLGAAVLHPAMLNYLDQTQSVGPGSMRAERIARRRRRNPDAPEIGLNENLAREILELHTLGVRSGYGQQDVTEFARALTGWTISGFRGGRGRQRDDIAPGQVIFADQLHEPGARMIIGKRYPDAGREQSLAVLDDLARSPKTARFLATKLARHFVSDTPPESIIARLEERYLASDGDLQAVYEALITAPEPWSQDIGKFRNPWDWAIAALRSVGLKDMPDRRSAINIFGQLGQPVWQPGSPAGFADMASAWAGPGALIARVEFAQQLARRTGNQLDARRLAERLHSDKLKPETLQAIARAESPSTGLALMIASPEFMRR